MDDGGWTGGCGSRGDEGHRGCRGRRSRRGHWFGSYDVDDADDYNKQRGARSKHGFEKMLVNPASASSGSTDQRPERERPPPHLRGRDIGMWYAARSKKNRQNAEINSRQPVHMNDSQQRELTSLLSTLRSNVEPQPRRNCTQLLQDEDSSGSEGMESEEDEKDKVKVKVEVLGPESKDTKEDGTAVSSDDESMELSLSPCKQWLKQEPESSSFGEDKMEEPSGSEKTLYGTELTTKKRRIPYVGDAANFDPIEDEIFDQDVASGLVRVKAERLDGMEAKAAEGMPDSLLTNEADGPLDGRKTDYNVEEPTGEGSCCTVEETVDVGELKEEGIDDVGDCVVELLQRPSQDGSSSDVKGLSMDYVGLMKDDTLDRDLELQIEAQQKNRKYVDMIEFRKKLPSYKMKYEIVDCVFCNQVVVLSGETGCGKTTQVPQFILDDYIERGCGSLCRVVCTQPRRISAITIAERVAEERAEPLGKSVGYQIRLDQKLPRTQASILYCTTGIMLKWLVSDPFLSKTSHIVLDEIHERDILSDFLMIIIRDLMKIRSDLKIVVMSATLNAESFSQYFNNCPMLNIPGFTFPVKQYLLEDVYELLQYKVQYLSSSLRLSRQTLVRRMKRREEQQEEQKRYGNWIRELKGLSKSTCDVLSTLPPDGFNDIDVDLVTMLIHFIVTNKPAGAILVFVPGWEQIKNLIGSISSQKFFQSANFRLIPLHSMMPTVNQREVFERPPPGVHKIVVATNIAETSITIDDVVYVIDCGKIKMKKFDAENNIATLLPEWVSRANAKQRSGRAGRVQPGECYHLYTSFHEAKFDDYQLPEMLRTRLEELCLQIKLLKLGRIKPFITKAMQPPLIESLDLAISTLFDLKALDKDEELTPLGCHLARMPVEPHVGKMLLFGAIFSCIDPITTIAASLGFRDAFYIPLGREKQADERRRVLSENSCSDHLMLAKAFKGWETARARGSQRQYCWDNFLSANTLMMLDAMKKQFAHLLHDMGFAIDTNPKAVPGNRNSANEKLLRAVICAGLYPNVAKLHQTVVSLTQQCVIKWPPRLSTKTDPKVSIHPKSVNSNERNFPSPHVVYFEKLKTAKIYVHDCTAVSTYSLLFFGGDIVVKKDRGQNCVVVDDWLEFKSSRRVAQLVQELRIELDGLLSRCVKTPGVYDRNDVALLRAIVKLVTTEDHTMSELPAAPRNSSSSLHDHRRGKHKRY